MNRRTDEGQDARYDPDHRPGAERGVFIEDVLPIEPLSSWRQRCVPVSPGFWFLFSIGRSRPFSRALSTAMS